MDIQDFLKLSLDELSAVSGLDKTRWSKYFNGKAINEKTLNRLAEKLSMKGEDLLSAINQKRREKELHKDAACNKLQEVAS